MKFLVTEIKKMSFSFNFYSVFSKHDKLYQEKKISVCIKRYEI